jgi:WD40 repeat protein
MRHDIAGRVPNAAQYAPALGGELSRRDFLALAAAGIAGATLATGCAPSASPSAVPGPTRTPLPQLHAPVGTITTTSTSRLASLGRLLTADGRIRGVAFSPDGRLLAAGGARYVHLWEAATGRIVHTWSGHTDQIYQLAWSAAAGLLASASADGTVRLWDPSQPAAVRVIGRGPTPSPVSVAWSPDGGTVLAGTLEGLALTWDARTGQQLTSFAGPVLPNPHRGDNPLAVYGVAWSPDGQRIATTRYDGVLFVRAAVSGALLATLHTDSRPNGLAWAPGGATFASTDDNGTIQIWNAASLRAVGELGARDSTSWAYGLAWAPDGRLIASARESGLIQVWDPRAASPLASLAGHTAPAWALAWSPDNQRLASGSDDTTVGLWGVE